MATAVFTYGSLMFPEVWERVVSGTCPSCAAVADGFERYCVAGETYPGMIAIPGQSVEGVVYFDVDAADLAALDVFEGEDYVRHRITVTLSVGGFVTAATYLYLPHDRLLPAVWQPETFNLQRFLDTYCSKRGV